MSGQIKYKTAEKYFLGGNFPDEGGSAFYFCFRKNSTDLLPVRQLLNVLK